MLDTCKNAIMEAMSVPQDYPMIKEGDPIGKSGVYYGLLRDGEYGTPRFDFSDNDGEKAITELVHEGKLEIKVRKGDLQIKFATT